MKEEMTTAIATAANRMVVVGGAGALGRQLIKSLLERDCQVVNVDVRRNDSTPHNVLLTPPLATAANLEEASRAAREHGPFSAVFVVAGGWQGGSVTSPSLFPSSLAMWEMNVLGALLGASIARSLAPNGLLVMTSAQASLGGTPGMIGYGMAKAAINQLVASLAAEGSSLPTGACTIAILPEILDTPTNREAMGKGADLSSWTPLGDLAHQLRDWALQPSSRPGSGSLVSVITKDSQTTFVSRR